MMHIGEELTLLATVGHLRKGFSWILQPAFVKRYCSRHDFQSAEVGYATARE